jgi:YD repeat-containing protein
MTLLAGAVSHGLAAAEPFAATNTLPLTNQVTITNYVVVTVTNEILTTNFSQFVATPEPERKPTDLPPLNWVPPPDCFDWIQLKSGEWLKGRLKAMQDRELEFYSEELKDFTFDWKDIRQVRSARTQDVLFVNGKSFSGPVAITTNQVTVGGAQPQTIAREQLQSLTPGGAKERNYWSGNLTLGLTLRAGNTESLEYNAQAHLQRRTPATRLSFDYIGNVSSSGGLESANNNRVNSEFDLWLSRRLYLVLPFAEYYRDPFQNLKSRLTGGIGVGYDLIDRPRLEWNVTAGPAYQYAVFESALPGEPTSKGAGALAFGSRFDWDITQRIELILEYRGQYTSKEVGETTHHAVSTLSLELTKRFDLDVSLTWDRITQPKIGADGIEPKPDDFRLIVGLGLDF